MAAKKNPFHVLEDSEDRRDEEDSRGKKKNERKGNISIF